MRSGQIHGSRPLGAVCYNNWAPCALGPPLCSHIHRLTRCCFHNESTLGGNHVLMQLCLASRPCTSRGTLSCLPSKGTPTAEHTADHECTAIVVVSARCGASACLQTG